MPSGTTRNGTAGSAASPPPASGGKGGGSLLFRVLSAVAFLPPFYFITRTGSLPFFLLVSTIALLGTWEAYRLFRVRGVYPLLLFGLLAAEVTLLLFFLGRLDGAFIFLVVFFLITLLSLLVRRRGSPFERGAGALFILLYAAVLPGFLILLRELPALPGSSHAYSEGAGFVFILFFIAWGSDTGAYTAGRIFGRHPLAPAISPKKTIEGAVGGMFFAVAGSWAGKVLLLPEIGPADVAVLGLVGGFLAQTGDLVESLLKRDANVKDTATMIPGHGGILDRFDGIFLAAPFVYFYLRIALCGGCGHG